MEGFSRLCVRNAYPVMMGYPATPWYGGWADTVIGKVSTHISSDQAHKSRFKGVTAFCILLAGGCMAWERLRGVGGVDEDGMWDGYKAQHNAELSSSYCVQRNLLLPYCKYSEWIRSERHTIVRRFSFFSSRRFYRKIEGPGRSNPTRPTYIPWCEHGVFPLYSSFLGMGRGTHRL